MKTFCDCRNPKFTAVGLFWCGPTTREDVLWVHSECRKPFKPIWAKYVKLCVSCWIDFFGPYEDKCKSCFKKEHPGEVYRGITYLTRIPYSVPINRETLKESA